MIKVLFETALTDVAKTDLEGVGTLRYGSDGRAWRWVKNRSTTTAIVAKQAVCYNEGNVGTSALFKSVNEPETENFMLAAGVAVTAIAASAADALEYGWICVQGYFQDAIIMNASATAIGIGDALDVADDANYLDHTVVDGVAPTYSAHFIALETATTTTSATELAKDVIVKCL